MNETARPADHSIVRSIDLREVRKVYTVESNTVQALKGVDLKISQGAKLRSLANLVRAKVPCCT